MGENVADPADSGPLDQAQALQGAGHWEQAIRAYQNVLDADSDTADADAEGDAADADLGMGVCYFRLGWKDLAVEHFQSYLDAGGDDPKIVALLAELAGQREKLAAPAGGMALAAAGPWSLQGEAGYAWGLSGDTFGHRFNRDGNANPFQYDYSVGQGFSYTLEPLFAVNPDLAVGLSANPVYTDVSGTETLPVSGIATADNTQARQFVLPVFLNVHAGSRVGSSLRVACFAGVGGVFTQPYVETSTDTYTGADGKAYTESVRYQRDLAPAAALRGGFSLQWILSPRCAAFLDATLMVAHESATAVSYSDEVFNAKGKVVGTRTDSNSYVNDPPNDVGVDAPTVKKTGTANTSATYAYDDGPTQWTTTVFYDNNGNLAPQQTNFTETNILANDVDGIILKTLAATAGLSWEF